MATQGAARIGDPCGGDIISTKAKNVNVNGRPVATRGSQVSPPAIVTGKLDYLFE